MVELSVRIKCGLSSVVSGDGSTEDIHLCRYREAGIGVIMTTTTISPMIKQCGHLLSAVVRTQLHVVGENVVFNILMKNE